jgi:hypothetical protein
MLFVSLACAYASRRQEFVSSSKGMDAEMSEGEGVYKASLQRKSSVLYTAWSSSATLKRNPEELMGGFGTESKIRRGLGEWVLPLCVAKALRKYDSDSSLRVNARMWLQEWIIPSSLVATTLYEELGYIDALSCDNPPSSSLHNLKIRQLKATFNAPMSDFGTMNLKRRRHLCMRNLPSSLEA